MIRALRALLDLVRGRRPATGLEARRRREDAVDQVLDVVQSLPDSPSRRDLEEHLRRRTP